MAIELNKYALAKSKSNQQEPDLVLEIDGVATKYSIHKVKKYVKIGDTGLLIDGSWTVGGTNNVDDQENLISWDGTTSNITQQLLQDKGGVNSVSALQLSLIDKNLKATKLISPGEVVTDILGRSARLWLGYKGTPFPESYTTIFTGVIDETDAGGTVILNIAHPEAKKRFDIFQERATVLTENADFRSEVIQSIKYKTRRGVVGTVTIEYLDAILAGNEQVSVVGNAISVDIESGVSTASQIRKVLEETIEALSLIELDVLENQSTTPQNAVGPTPLNSDTTLTVEKTTGFLTPSDSGTITTYVRINDEIIQYTGKTDTTFTGCTREAFILEDPRTRGELHEAGAEVTSFVRLQGNAIDLALKLMLSGENEYFKTDQVITSFVTVPDVGDVPNAVYFSGINVRDFFGLTVGDFVTTTSDTYAANDFNLRAITEVVVLEAGSYFVVDGAALAANAGATGLASFKSKYNVLVGVGLGLGGHEVDVPEFERIKETYFSSIFNYDFYITQTEKGKEFIDQELMFPTGAYTIPRKGKISLGFTSPPLSINLLPLYNSTNVAKPNTNRVKRSINKYFYNNVIFKYNQNALDSDRFLSGEVTVDTDSKAQIPVGNKSFVITSRGLRPSSDNNIIMGILTERFLERYKFAAEYTQAQMFYGKSFNVDVGDAVLYGDNNLKLIDTRNATRGSKGKIYEVINKSLDIKTGVVVLTLVDTNFLSSGRYGVFGPSSLIGTGATTPSIPVVNSFGWNAPRTEKEKWEPFIGTKILVRDDDFTVSEETTFTGFDPGNNSILLLNPPLSFVPSAGYIIEQPNYYGDNINLGAEYKNVHCFFDPTVPIVSGASATTFDVGASDASDVLFVGATIVVHTRDSWAVISPEVRILSIVGTTVTVDNSLGFTPDNTYDLELIGFKIDEGAAYRWL